ncbi:MAG TPA: 3-deoxy-D-manno-octulosonic acid transferase [Ferrovibrio sp.]|uniref:3-deoxy-D-manno-octulosonic acid transferase n=1 Tax=Ferrovibrio sp. TaxID=1917215 RepID=UPI002ED26B97
MASDWRRSIWRGAGHLLGPVLHLWLHRRARRGKEDPERLQERLGRASLPRPDGILIWCHAASVGEAQSVLPLLQHLHKQRPDLILLLTTGTVTSAALVKQRGGPGILHQYAPLDLPGAVDSFLAHWRPSLALWTESEFWPGLLNALKQRGLPVLLVNARMSERSCRRWALAPDTARWLLGCFTAIFAQTMQDAERLRRLGAGDVQQAGNLKQAAPPLPADDDDVVAWQMMLAQRPRWLAASTHPGEEDVVAGVHRTLKLRFPQLLTLIVPRHPKRGPEIAASLAAQGLCIALRSRGDTVDEATDIYIADTMGELGLWYRVSSLAFMGGSLIPHGGQNPLEPARLGCAVLFGPSMFNFSEAVDGLIAAGGAQQIADEAELTAAAGILLAEPQRCEAIGENARAYAAEQGRIIEALTAAVLERLAPV